MTEPLPSPRRGAGPAAVLPRRFVYDCPVRWSDMDAFGHINNARFLTLYEEARIALMFTAAREHGLTSFEEGVVIARHEVDEQRHRECGEREQSERRKQREIHGRAPRTENHRRSGTSSASSSVCSA